LIPYYVWPLLAVVRTSVTDADIPQNVLDERLRNRCIDVLELLTGGDETVLQFGASGYFNWFFDWFPDEGVYDPPSTMTSEEAAAASIVLAVMREACDATPRFMTEDELIATGWPRRVQLVSTQALIVFMARGRGDED
jgi:hypothetical protein